MKASIFTKTDDIMSLMISSMEILLGIEKSIQVKATMPHLASLSLNLTCKLVLNKKK